MKNEKDTEKRTKKVKEPRVKATRVKAEKVKEPKVKAEKVKEPRVKAEKVKAKKIKEPKVKTGKGKEPKVRAEKAKASGTGKVKNGKAKPQSEKKQSGKKEGKREVSLFRSIRFRLIASFMVPVLGIIVLGVTSYQKASDAIINNYQDSVEQTMDMMQQYVNLVVVSEKDEFKSYLNESDLKAYFAGRQTAELAGSTNKTYMDKIRNKMALDSKISAAYFLADEGKSVYVASITLPENAYSDYTATAQGTKIKEDIYNWFLFGQDPEADEALGIKTDSYSLRLVRNYNEAKAIMMVDLDETFVREAMQSMDAGEDGYVALVTSDGHEFFSDEELQPEEPIFFGQDFYNKVVESENISGTETVTVDGQEYLFIYSKLEDTGAMATALIPTARLLAETNEIKTLSVVLILVAVIVSVLLGILMSSQMSGTIHYILRQLRKVSHGDLTVHLTSKKKDEFGLLCDGVNNTVSHVKSLIENVNEVSIQLNETAAYVSEASGTFMKTSNDIQHAISEIEQGVNKLDSGSEDCLNQMDSLSGKITNVSLNADEIGKLTSTTGETINSGIDSVQGLTSSAESTTRITRNVIEAIESLEEKSRSISKIVSAINDIAEQTNLLSLNASIEAARAGEAGRGFAVVAEEIRKLADQCLTSAGQISSIINEIMDKTGEVVGIAKQAEEVVSTQTGAVEDTTTSFRMIDSQVESLLKALETISSNVQEMNASRTETLEAIESISAVSAETAACSSTVYTTAGTQLNAIEDLDKASQQLRDKAEHLVEMLGTFTV